MKIGLLKYTKMVPQCFPVCLWKLLFLPFTSNTWGVSKVHALNRADATRKQLFSGYQHDLKSFCKELYKTRSPMNCRFQNCRNSVPWSQKKCPQHIRTLLNKVLSAPCFTSTSFFLFFFSFRGSFMTRSKKTDIRSRTNYIFKMRFLVKIRYLCLKGSKIPDGEEKQGNMQLMRGITSKTMQEIISHTSI